MHDLGTCEKPHSKELSIGKAVTIFRFCKSMTRDTRGERGLSHGSLRCHQVLMEPGYSFTSPESWIPRDWQSPLNWAPTMTACTHNGSPVWSLLHPLTGVSCCPICSILSLHCVKQSIRVLWTKELSSHECFQCWLRLAAL